MTDPLKAFMQANSLVPQAFPPDSRYHGLDTARFRRADGGEVTYVKRRFIPPAEQFATVREHLVVDGDRIDNVAARHLGDPQLYWRLCDANVVLDPDELTKEAGRRVRVTLPAGVPGGADV